MSFILNGHVLAGASGPSVNRYTDNPAMDGTASPGASGQYADGAHVHPSDTTKADKSDLASIKATGSTNGTGSTIAAGTYFYLNDVLVYAKTSIASGATFTSGTNYEVITAGALNDLKSAIDVEHIVIGQNASNSFITLSEFVAGVYGSLVMHGKFAVLNLTVSFVANKTLTMDTALFTLNQYKPKEDTLGVGYCQYLNVPAFYPKMYTTGRISENMASNMPTGSGGWGIMSIAYEIA